jgi:hypothetical protein
MIQLHKNRIAVPSFTTIKEKYVLHVAITNYRSCKEDFKLLIKEITRLGRKLLSKKFEK